MNANDLSEEVQARDESKIWDLRPCPCCGYKADVNYRKGSVQILCARWGCRTVEGPEIADAVYLWNQPRFTDL